MCKVYERRAQGKRVKVMLNDGRLLYSPWYKEPEDASEDRIGSGMRAEGMCSLTIMNHNVTEGEVKGYTVQFERKADDDSIYISEHAMKRLKERNGWGRKASLRMVARAYDKGTPAADVKGPHAPWARHREAMKEPGDELLMYGTSLYVFKKKVLATVLTAPADWGGYARAKGGPGRERE